MSSSAGSPMEFRVPKSLVDPITSNAVHFGALEGSRE
jgi:hypothetical protein